jgi:hypothetical protein
MNSLNKSQLEEDDEKVTRETAAYNRLDAVLRVTKPLCEKQIEPIDDDYDDNEPIKTGENTSFIVEWSISIWDVRTMVRVFLVA